MDDVVLFNRGQVSLFVIFGAVLAFLLVFIFFSYNPRLDLFGGKISSPSEYLSDCIESAILDSEKEFFDSKEIIQNRLLNFKYRKETISFLCYSSAFYLPCVPQAPLFIEAIRKNMENKVSRELSRCVLTLKENYESKGYNFDYSSFDFSLNFQEDEIFYTAKIPIKLSKGETVAVVSSGEGAVSSALPRLLRTSESIVNYESTFCEFDYIFWQAVNRDISIQRFMAGDQTKVYTVEDRDSKKQIKFAIRTCVLPAGI
jgi:hypothetical protein